MPEQRHQRLQAHASIRQLGGPGVTQLVWRDDEYPAVGCAEPCGFGGGEQAVAQPCVAKATSVLGEQEVGEGTGAWVRQRPVHTAERDPLVEGGEYGRR
ncbi:hypothetical protein AWC32_00430 [Mycobacterium xenopi]|uniref:Uncharacterized protein n=1 Tax=Mycobacterium xenopi TaxID=1789 RepID=A0AAD1M3Q8_MYCXE|nr:hypothetical protein AWC32_00430 [Mycobacterium xenopi]BBU24760.1 hypothetical protein MYXE_45500 [Mycobacterium xenopi]SPX89948.1 Uncharacterised protein [Mycobacterium xenopi]